MGGSGQDDEEIGGDGESSNTGRSGVSARPPAPPRSWRHELRNPLNQIIGYSQLLREDAADAGRPELVDDLGKIESAGRVMLEVIEAMPLAGDARGRVLSSKPPVERRSLDSLPAAAPATPGGRVLVVDDNELNRDVLSRRLEQRGYDVETAVDGPSALDRLAGSSFDLVLLDVVMPGMSGMDVLVTLRRDNTAAELPIIMATARGDSDDVVSALKAGANDYVTKPLDMAVVVARVETQLSLKRARDQVAELNERLAAAQERIGRLLESSSEALDDVKSWATSVIEELTDAVGAKNVGVWLFEAQSLSKIAGDTTSAPSVSDIAAMSQTGRHLVRGDETIVPVIGLAGEVFGALVVESGTSVLGGAGERLLSTFARHLGGALEMKRLRRDLAAAAERRRETRQGMLDRGVDLLQICQKCRRCFNHKTTTCPIDGALLSAPRLFPHRVAGRYELMRVVGEGGMGTVFRSKDLRLDREVAVKVIRAEHFNDETVRTRFEQEARTVARIDHPGVVAVFDSGELDDGSLFIVMEWLEGRDLGFLLRRFGPGTPSEVLSLLRQAAAALEAAHRARLVHRDIKPENLLLSAAAGGFRVKVLDFGVAKELSTNVSLTRTGSLVGTPLFMSPEQLLGRPIDARSDIYSLAAVGYQALTGRRVVQADQFADVMYEVINAQAPPVSAILGGAPSKVDEAFRSALAKDLDLRPESAQRWVESFAAHLEDLPTDNDGWLDSPGAFDVDSARLRSDPESPDIDGDATTLGGSAASSSPSPGDEEPTKS